MAMLTHDFERPFQSRRRQSDDAKPQATAHLASIKRFCVCALATLLAGGAIAAGIALKTAIYFTRFHLGTG